MSRLDWGGLMRAGLHELRLSPRDFWAMTPAELQIALGRSAPPAGMDRARLDALLARFPDATPGDRSTERATA